MQKRRLAAIMFTDIVGYTSLMGEDERHALEKLKKSHQTQKEIIEKHDGKWLKEIGDGVLAEFQSALNAVESAIDIQKDSEPGLVRIGIHLGDVFYEQDEVYGDGVNIASRIESEASPGGICVSETVYQNIKNQKDIQTSLLGTKKLKNVSSPIALYQIKGDGISTRSVSKSRSLSLLAAIFLVMGFSVLTGLLTWMFKPGKEMVSPEARYYEVMTPEEAPVALIGSADFGFGQPALDLSPDGSCIVYAGKSGNTTQLFIRYMNDLKTEALQGTEGAYYPFFSYDGEWVGFMSENKLKKVSLKENSIFTICDVTYPSGAVWLPDEEIVFVDNQGASLKKVSSRGGIPDILEDTNINPQLSGWIYYPQLLPGAKEIICNIGNNNQIIIYSLETREVKKVEGIRGNTPHYLSTGHIACIVQNVLVAIPFDLKKKAVVGNMFPIEEPVRSEAPRPGGQYAISQNGKLVYIPGLSAAVYKFLWVSRKGESLEMVNLPADRYGQFRLSYDGQKIAYPVYPDIWIYDILEDIKTIISNTSANYSPHWISNDQVITWTSNREGIQKIYQRPSNGSGPETLFIDSVGASLISVSKDGRCAIIHEGDKTFFYDFTLNERLLLPTEVKATQMDLSPDGRHFLYLSDETGQNEVYVKTFPFTDDRWNVSHGLGIDPIWSPNGDEIFYRTVNQWYSVRIDTQNGFKASKPEFLFEGNYIDIGGKSFAVSPDGKKFLVLEQVNQDRFSEVIVFVDNWLESVKSKTSD